MAKSPKSQETTAELTQVEAAAEPKPTNDRPVEIALDDVTATVAEVNEPARAAAVAYPKEIYEDAHEDNRQRDFVKNIMDARAQTAVKEYTPPPVPEAVQRQTELEMQAGRDTVAKHAERAAYRPKPQTNESMVPVFRPGEYVPDQKKGQGVVTTASSRSGNL